MECPYCHSFIGKGKTLCPCCGYLLGPERRAGDRRKVSKRPPRGIERRKKNSDRRSASTPLEL